MSKKEKIFSSYYFKKEFKKHKKNMVFNEYIKHKNSQISKIDSFLVFKLYEKGLKDSLFYFPKKALVKEIKSSSEAFIDSAFSLLLQNKSFDFVFSKFGDKKEKGVLKRHKSEIVFTDYIKNKSTSNIISVINSGEYGSY